MLDNRVVSTWDAASSDLKASIKFDTCSEPFEPHTNCEEPRQRDRVSDGKLAEELDGLKHFHRATPVILQKIGLDY